MAQRSTVGRQVLGRLEASRGHVADSEAVFSLGEGAHVPLLRSLVERDIGEASVVTRRMNEA